MKLVMRLVKDWRKKMENEFKQSEFNEAAFEMMRHHDSQSKMNHFKLNLEIFNTEFQNYNFNLYFIALTSLFQESSKIRIKTKEKIIAMKQAIDQFMRKNPVYIRLGVNGTIVNKFNKESLEALRDFLFKYEDEIRQARDEHGYTSPTKEDYDGL